MAAADTVCAIRKRRVVRRGAERRKIHRMAVCSVYPRSTPTSGDSSIGRTTLSTMPDQCTVAEAASAAPTSPPISACEDEVGSPRHQVKTFHPMAPTSAHRTSSRPEVSWGAPMMPLPTVSATPVPRKAPKKFITAAMASAARGVRALVEIEVAMAFAASWKPLVKSNVSPTMMISTTRVSSMPDHLSAAARTHRAAKRSGRPARSRSGGT